jgi:23S rRNA pseudouridine2605 synthase
MTARRRTQATPDSARRRRRSADLNHPVEPRAAVSLYRALSKLGVASRTEADTLIRTGRVRVDGRLVWDPRLRVDPDASDIRVDGRRVRAPQPQFWLLNKPVGIITTRHDERARRTVFDLLPREVPHVVAVGRLDADSSGLLLLTNDTQLAARLTDPESHIPKVYEVELDAPIGAAAARQLSAGVLIEGRLTRPARFELLETPEARRVRVTLTEGRNRQVRRMFQSMGRTVRALRRVAIGPLHIRGLAEGQVRPLRAAEVAKLLALKQGTQERKPSA